jgi:hypothetical protein
VSDAQIAAALINAVVCSLNAATYAAWRKPLNLGVAVLSGLLVFVLVLAPRA